MRNLKTSSVFINMKNAKYFIFDRSVRKDLQMTKKNGIDFINIICLLAFLFLKTIYLRISECAFVDRVKSSSFSSNVVKNTGGSIPSTGCRRTDEAVVSFADSSLLASIEKMKSPSQSPQSEQLIFIIDTFMFFF